MTLFVDTSAIYALVDASDDHHSAAHAFIEELDASERLVTHNYVVVESVALVQARLSLAAVRALMDDLMPRLELEWVGEDLHRPALAALLSSGARRISFVDRVSFEVMRRLGIRKAFAFDPDFSRQGFAAVP